MFVSFVLAIPFIDHNPIQHGGGGDKNYFAIIIAWFLANGLMPMVCRFRFVRYGHNKKNSTLCFLFNSSKSKVSDYQVAKLGYLLIFKLCTKICFGSRTNSF